MNERRRRQQSVDISGCVNKKNSETMKSAKRIFTILLLALGSGVLVNQLLPAGINWHFLLPSSITADDGAGYQIEVISPDSAFTFLSQKNFAFLDIRPAADYALDRIPQAVNVPYQDLFRRQKNIDWGAAENWIVYDQEGEMDLLERTAAYLAGQKGRHVLILYGGYLNWLNRSFPVERGDSYRVP